MFKKLKNLFKRIFLNQKLLEEKRISEDNILKTEIITPNFKNQLNTNSKIYELQRMYEKGRITEDELTIRQIKSLINLYKQQINA